MIGAMDLSEKAKALEIAAKENDEAFIADNHFDMLREYKALTGNLSSLSGIAGEMKDDTPPEGNDTEPSDISPEDDEDEILEFEPVDGEGGEG